ncbi:MAG: hypothetical protein JXP34_28540, partial [Planctomycetes bacterium]|nr:hypothetical protein [Planctomycetota bacterium]
MDTPHRDSARIRQGILAGALSVLIALVAWNPAEAASITFSHTLDHFLPRDAVHGEDGLGVHEARKELHGGFHWDDNWLVDEGGVDGHLYLDSSHDHTHQVQMTIEFSLEYPQRVKAG